VDDTSPPWQTWILLGLLRDRPPTCAKSPSRLWQAWRLSAASHATYLGGLRSRIGAPLGRSVHASVTPFSTTKINSFDPEDSRVVGTIRSSPSARCTQAANRGTYRVSRPPSHARTVRAWPERPRHLCPDPGLGSRLRLRATAIHAAGGPARPNRTEQRPRGEQSTHRQHPALTDDSVLRDTNTSKLNVQLAWGGVRGPQSEGEVHCVGIRPSSGQSSTGLWTRCGPSRRGMSSGAPSPTSRWLRLPAG
jgi:hypothetical protein